MKNGIMRRIMALFLICTMLAGQEMVNTAYATDIEEIPVTSDDENNSIDFEEEAEEPEEENPGEEVITGEEENPGEEEIPGIEDNLSEEENPSGEKTPDGEDHSDEEESSESDLLYLDDILFLEESDEEMEESGGISVRITTTPSSGTELKDGDKFSFTVIIRDDDLNLEPNIKPGDILTIQMPSFLSPEDKSGWLANCEEYFEIVSYNDDSNVLKLRFKEFSGSNLNISLTFSMLVDTIGYEGNGKGSISVGIGDTVKADTGITVDTGTGSGTGTGDGDGDGEETTETKLYKRIWSNSKPSGSGDGLIIRDPKEPIGYSVGFYVMLNSGQTAVLSDDLSGGNLILCDARGNTDSPSFSVTVGASTQTGMLTGDSLSFNDPQLGSITITKTFDGGFSLTCKNDTNESVGPVSVSVSYYAKASGDASRFNNRVNFSIDGNIVDSSSSFIRKYDNSALYATKSIGDNGGTEIDLDEQTEVTFCITLTQYGVGDVYLEGEEVTFDVLENCFIFNENKVTNDRPDLFGIQVVYENDKQKIRIVKVGEDPIPAGSYHISFTVTIDKNKLDYGQATTNTVGNTVHIRRKAKLTIDKEWIGENISHGSGAGFVLYNGNTPIASTGEYSDATSYTLYIRAGDLASGTHTYTLREEVDPANGYQAAPDIPVVITKASDGTITFANNSGAGNVAVTNEPDSGRGSLTFKKYGGSVSDANLLDGGTYRLYRYIEGGEDELVETFSTTGGIYTKELSYGIYYVEEVSAPNGYLIEGTGTTGQVELKKTAPYQSVSLVNQRFEDGIIEILKVDAEKNNSPLSGVQFTIEKPDKTKQTVTTDASGLARFTGLCAGEYRIEETGPLAGYVGFEGPIWVTINETGELNVERTAEENLSVTGKTLQITWNNTQQFGSVQICKRGINSALLEGAVFELYDSKGILIANGTTGADGKLCFTGLAFGTYLLKETKAPEGYVISEELANGKQVKIDSTVQVDLNFTNTTKKGSITITKKDAETDSLLSGAVFGLYSEVSCASESLIEQRTTLASGSVTFTGLEAGNYYVREITAPTGYQLNDSVLAFQVGIKAEGQIAQWDFQGEVENQKRIYGLKIVKTAEDKMTPLSGAEFELTGQGISQNRTTGPDGTAMFAGLPFGTYTITETKAPAGYALAEPITVTIDRNNTPDIYDVNQVVDGGILENSHTRLTVYKVDDKNESVGLPGTTFVIREGNQYVAATGGNGAYVYTGLVATEEEATKFVTADGGIFTLEYIPMGSYTLVETDAPDGYVISQNPRDFTISSSESSVTMGNSQIKAALRVVKTDEYGKLLPEIGFRLKTATGYVSAAIENGVYQYTGLVEEDKATVFQTGADGTFQVNGLLWGRYTLLEDSETTPVGLIPAGGIDLAVTDDSETWTITQNVVNKRLLGDISFIKKDSDSHPLSGAVFMLEMISGNDYSESEKRYAVSDHVGRVIFQNVPYGEYKITEYLAPYGKTLSKEEFTVTVDGQKAVYELSDWVNEDLTIPVIIRKAGTDGKHLTGAIFQILDNDKKVLEGYDNLEINDPEGEKIFLPVGVYYLKEIQAPTNYILNSELLQFRVTEDGAQSPIEVVMDNEPVTGSLTIVKRDEADATKLLSGAEFKVYRKGDYQLSGDQAKALYTVSTNSDGTVTIRDIPFGDYAVVETVAPAGYERSAEPQYFSIFSSDETVSLDVRLEFTNEKSHYVLEISKVDAESGIYLSGAKFVVYAANFNMEVETDETGKVVVEVPAPGTYQVVEIGAPDGHTIDPQVYQVIVEEHTPVGAEAKAQFVSKDYPTRVSLNKVDENGETLEGATFRIYEENGGAPVSFVQGEQGIYVYSPGSDLTDIPAGSAVIEQLPFGSYILRETETPDGYMALGDIAFTVSGSLYNQVISITAQNLPYKRGVAVCKENEKGVRLAGAVFTLYDADGKELQSMTTGASGYAVFMDLESGSYSIQETAAPEGYQKIDTEYCFQIDGNGELYSEHTFVRCGSEDTPLYVLTLVNESVEHALQLKKVSSISGATLAGARFRILGNGINTVYVTGEDGLTEMISLPVGEYMLTEIQAPDGYNADATSHHLEVNAEGIQLDEETLTGPVAVYTISNEPLPFSFAIVKQDATSRLPLEHAVFTVKGEDGSWSTLVSNEKGQTDVISLKPGRYAVAEIQAPEGYNVPLAGWSFTVEEGTCKVTSVTGGAEYTYEDGVLILTLTNERTTGSLLICKHSAEDETLALAGARFQVKNADGKAVWFTLRNGVYHAADSDTPGAGNVLKTNAMGQALLEGLRFGEYTVYEITAPEGYELFTEGISIRLTRQDETLKVNVANKQLTRKVTVYKQSAGENPEKLIGAVFALYRVNEDGNRSFISEATTGYDGKAEFTVPYGDYVIAETRAPAGYELSQTQPWEFSFNGETPEDYVFTYTFVNEKTCYDLEIYKYDAEQTDKALAGAEFTVTNSRGYSITIKTGPDGIARLEDIDYDDYTIREVTAPEGYFCNEQIYTITRDDLIHGQAVRIEVPDVRILGTVLLRKVDFEKHEQILNADFTISDSDDQLLHWQESEDGYILSDTGETTIHAGEVKLSGIPAGDYTISEVKAPTGYMILDENRSFTVNAGNAAEVIEIEIENLLRKVAVGIIKMDGADKTKRLAGAEFTLYPVVDGVVGDVLATSVTNENGLAVFTDLAMGNYRIIETKAPYGFKLWSNPIDFIVDEEGKVWMGKDHIGLPEIEQVYMVGVLNTSILRNLELRKVSSETGEPLSGATFTITGNEMTWRVTTDEDGKAVLQLPYGEYVLQELIAPNGYILDESKHLIQVSENGISIDGAALKEFVYELQNTPVDFALYIHKQDSETADPLSGAEFQLSGNGVSYKLKTNANGNTDTIYLKPGQYTLTETKAPNGYMKPMSSWKMTVSEEGRMAIQGEYATVAVKASSVTVTIENVKKTTNGGGTSGSGGGSGGSSGGGSYSGSGIAKTGQTRNSVLLLSGAFLMLMSFIGLLFLVIDEYRRRRSLPPIG
ncbi:MAG: hypothetical protein MR416_09505 [Lachnospiraceae bacterium]|nr:hypothetical protein [Lachnospiraceae bacterium]MDY5541656.1 SpaA isopeptide-forming pilin-related protein [Lachnospiraceae bacterium]